MTTPIANILDHYEIAGVLGQGGFSTVFAATELATQEIVAIKNIRKNEVSESGESFQEENVRREIDVLALMKGVPRIVQMLHCYEDQDDIFIVFELLLGCELFDIICEKGNFSEDETRSILLTVIEALDYCHRHQIVHRDVKPENIMTCSPDFPDKSDVKLIDFGLATLISSPDGHMTGQGGTEGYSAPELLQTTPYTFNVDMWSLGVTAYILLVGFPPWDDEDLEMTVFRQVVTGRYSFPSPEWDTVSDDAKDFVTYCLKVNPEERMTSEEAFLHPFFAAEPRDPMKLLEARERAIEREKEARGRAEAEAREKELELLRQKELAKENELLKQQVLEKERENEILKQKELEKEKELEEQRQVQLERENESLKQKLLEMERALQKQKELDESELIRIRVQEKVAELLKQKELEKEQELKRQQELEEKELLIKQKVQEKVAELLKQKELEKEETRQKQQRELEAEKKEQEERASRLRVEEEKDLARQKEELLKQEALLKQQEDRKLQSAELELACQEGPQAEPTNVPPLQPVVIPPIANITSPATSACACPHCGEEISLNRKFCLYCGKKNDLAGDRKPVPRKSNANMLTCVACGFEGSNRHKFCLECGGPMANPLMSPRDSNSPKDIRKTTRDLPQATPSGSESVESPAPLPFKQRTISKPTHTNTHAIATPTPPINAAVPTTPPIPTTTTTTSTRPAPSFSLSAPPIIHIEPVHTSPRGQNKKPITSSTGSLSGRNSIRNSFPRKGMTKSTDMIDMTKVRNSTSHRRSGFRQAIENSIDSDSLKQMTPEEFAQMAKSREQEPNAPVMVSFPGKNSGKIGETMKIPFELSYQNSNGTSRPALVDFGDLELDVAAPSGPLPAQVVNEVANRYTITFLPSTLGKIHIKLTIKKKYMHTFYFFVTGVSCAKNSYLEGANSVPVGVYQYKVFTMDNSNTPIVDGGDKIQFNIKAPSNSFKDFVTSNNGDGSYTVTIHLANPATVYEFHVQVNGEALGNSPLIVATNSS